MTRIPLSAIGYLHGHGHPLPTYTGPPWRPAPPDHYEHACDVIAWHRDHPEATCSPKIAHLLSQLERDFAPRTP